MRGLILSGPGEIEVRTDLPEPEVTADHDAIIAVELAGLCGSDLHPYAGREPFLSGMIPGHELVGTILEAGDALGAFQPGDRVFAPFTTSCGACHPCRRELSSRCSSGEFLGLLLPEGAAGEPTGGGLNGAQAERVRVPLADTTLLPLPKLSGLPSGGGDASVPELTAILLADNFTTGWFAAEGALGVRIDEASTLDSKKSVAVVGCGAVGLAAISAARSLGAKGVIAIDPVAERREIAASLGAEALSPDAAIARIGGNPEAGRVETVIEAVGNPAAQSMAVQLLLPGGTLMSVGVHNPPFGITPADLYDGNLTYRAGRAPVKSILDRILPAIESGRITVPVDAMISDPRVPLSEGPDAYRRFAERAEGVRKMVFDPSE